METRKLWTSLLAAATLSVMLAVSATPATASTTADTAVKFLERAGVLAGTNCSTESCEGDLLRWEAAVWFARTLDLRSGEAVNGSDVPAGTNILDAVVAIARQGVTVGCGTEPFRFCGESQTTRAQMASFLARTFDLKPGRRVVLADVDRDSVHAKNISAIWRAGIARSCSKEARLYCPHDPVSRRQAARMLYRALKMDEADFGASQRGSSNGNSESSGNSEPDGNSESSGEARRQCPVVDRFNQHHDHHDHRGDPDGETSYALLPDGTLFGHRHDHGDVKCWKWDPPDENGEGSNPQDVESPDHVH